MISRTSWLAFLGIINIITDREKKDVFVRGGSFTGNDLDIKDIGVNYSEQRGDWFFAGYARAFADKGETFRNLSDGIKTEVKTKDPREGIDFYSVLGYKDLDVRLRYTRRDHSEFFFGGSLGNDINKSRMENSSVRFSYQPELVDNLTLDLNGGYSVTEWDGKTFLFPVGFSPIPGRVLQNPLIGGPIRGLMCGKSWP